MRRANRTFALALLPAAAALGAAPAASFASAPVVMSVAVPANGTYGAGQNLDFVVNWDQPVTVTGTPRTPITLDVGGTVYANFVSAPTNSSLLFRAVVASGQRDLDGITVGSSIQLNGGTIQDALLNDAVLTLNSVGATTNVLVDAIPPGATSMTVPASGTYRAGQYLDSRSARP